MSMSLLKKSMAIVEENLEQTKKAKEQEISRKQKDIHKQKGNRLKEDRLFKTKKKTINDIRKEMQLNEKRADENVQKLLALTKHTVKIPNAEKILQRAHKGRYIVEEKKRVEQESLYTEEDFAAFEKELAKMI